MVARFILLLRDRRPFKVRKFLVNHKGQRERKGDNMFVEDFWFEPSGAAEDQSLFKKIRHDEPAMLENTKEATCTDNKQVAPNVDMIRSW